MLNIISSYLRDSEFELVDTARDGKLAVESFQQLKPDLVLLDLVMPGQSGQETLRQMIELRPDAQIAIVSSLGTEEAVKECSSLGARGFLKKPFSKDDLLEFLRGMTGSPVIHTRQM
jgi:two-component system chemotaxis response regulator CheY